MNERLVQIFDKFNQRDDNVFWDIELIPNGEKIHIKLQTNDAYARGREVMTIKLEKTIGLDEEDYIEKIAKIH